MLTRGTVEDYDSLCINYNEQKIIGWYLDGGDELLIIDLFRYSEWLYFLKDEYRLLRRFSG